MKSMWRGSGGGSTARPGPASPPADASSPPPKHQRPGGRGGGGAGQPDTAAAEAVDAGYGGRGSLDDLAAMLQSHTHHNHPVGAALKKQISAYTEELKLVHVIKPGVDSARFAERIFADVLT